MIRRGVNSRKVTFRGKLKDGVTAKRYNINRKVTIVTICVCVYGLGCVLTRVFLACTSTPHYNPRSSGKPIRNLDGTLVFLWLSKPEICRASE